MNRFFRGVLSHRKFVIALFVCCAIAGAILSLGVKVNYTFADYLPQNTASTVALETMNEEFDGGAPNARLVIPDVTIPEALEMKEKIGGIDGVDGITWLDDAADIEGPLELIEEEVLEEYYKDGKACFSLTIDSDRILSTVTEVRKQAGEDALMEGSAVNTAVATETTGTEVSHIMIIVVPLCLVILLLTTTSWFEPILFLLTIGIAILINIGTNLFFGEISFVTKAASSILQLAVSMDYSIFLLHRFSAYRKEGMDVREAMINAMHKSFFTITASGLTTVIGFAALICMKFRIGPDMGVVMVKAIALSLISVLVLLPAMALVSYRLIDRTQHRPLLPEFGKFAGLVFKIRVPAMILFLLIITPAFLAQGDNDFRYGAGDMFGKGTQVYEDRIKVESTFGKTNQMVMMVPRGDTAKEKELSDVIYEIPQVTNVISYVDTAGAEVPIEYLDEDTLSQLVSEHYSRMVISVSTEPEGKDAFSVVEKLRQLGKKYYGGEYLLAGDSVSTYDMREVTTSDMQVVNFIAIGAIFLILLLTMRSLSIPVVLVLVIETAVWMNLSVPYFTGEHLQYIAYLIISSIQLGATVDYAILMASRYLEERSIRPKGEAVLEAVKNTSLSILTSASILTLAGLILGAISTNGVLKELGVLVGRGAIFSAILVLLVLPGILYLLDKVIEKTTWKANFFREDKQHG